MTVLTDELRHYLEDELERSEVSPFGLAVAAILDDIWGLRNLRRFSTIRSLDWRHESMIWVGLSGSLATYDGSQLTHLVVRCHDACIRLQVDPLTSRQLRLTFSRRDRVGHRHERHPELEAAIKHVRAGDDYGSIRRAGQPEDA
jgi:hypothetical protein